jgi:hypothetical protein
MITASRHDHQDHQQLQTDRGRNAEDAQRLVVEDQGAAAATRPPAAAT